METIGSTRATLADPPAPDLPIRRFRAKMRAVDAREARKKGTSRITRLHEDDGAFDREFWSSVPPSRRLEAVWDLVLEYLAWREPDGGQPRLQRSVLRVERRRG
jgi:hypothetical protein